MKAIYIILGSIAGLSTVVVLAIFFQVLDFGMFKTFAPKYEQVRHDTFECSQTHTTGTIRDLREIRDEFAHADAAGKAILADRFRHEADGFTCYALPSDLQSFSDSVR